MGKRRVVGISLNNHIIEELDIIRGMIPRSRFIEKCVTEFINQREFRK